MVVIMDRFTRKVLGWRVSITRQAKVCLAALNEATHKFGKPEIKNTDQGHQFTFSDWTVRLKRARSKTLVDGEALCPDIPRGFFRTNGVHALDMSRLWRSLKCECVYLHAWQTASQARAGVGRRITFFNHLRIDAGAWGQ